MERLTVDNYEFTDDLDASFVLPETKSRRHCVLERHRRPQTNNFSLSVQEQRGS